MRIAYFGIPIDAIGMDGAVERIAACAKSRRPLFVSTPNLNFLMIAQRDPEFGRSLRDSDLCLADGAGVLLICRLLGIPIRQRVAGSDIPRALMSRRPEAGCKPISVVLFGGAPGVGETACEAINRSRPDQLVCRSAIDPGYGSIDDISRPDLIRQLNASGADFLIAALGAQKGQAWILRNRQSLSIPVVSHLGATLNFIAGTVRRAPMAFQRLGLEWLWRIKEEPQLAARYWRDGIDLLRAMGASILPLAAWLCWHRKLTGCAATDIDAVNEGGTRLRVRIGGTATREHKDHIKTAFRSAIAENSEVVLDLAGLQWFDMSFAASVIALHKALERRGGNLKIVASSASIAKALRWAGLTQFLRSS